jgi:hypothetical protein
MQWVNRREGILELSLATVAIPEPKPEEVIVRIDASPINLSLAKTSSGSLRSIRHQSRGPGLSASLGKWDGKANGSLRPLALRCQGWSRDGEGRAGRRTGI